MVYLDVLEEVVEELLLDLAGEVGRLREDEAGVGRLQVVKHL